MAVDIFHLVHVRPAGYDDHRPHAYDGAPQVDACEVAGIAYPFRDEVGRHGTFYRQAEEILDLSGEDGERDTAGETYYDGIGDILDDGAQTKQTQHYEEHAREQCGNHKALYAILSYDARDDDDESARGATYLHLGTTQQRDDQACHDGCGDALLWGHSRGYTEGYGQWQSHYAYDDAGKKVLDECFAVVML